MSDPIPLHPARATPSGPGRTPQISRDDLVAAALRLLGPHRSISTLSLREVAREADIAPNSFYRHFRDMDALAIALIELGGRSLRTIIREARTRLKPGRSVIRTSIETFMEQLDADERLLHILLREGMVGSDAYKAAVERELRTFEEELCIDLVRLSEAGGRPVHAPALVATAMPRLVFAMGATAIDLPRERRGEVVEQLVEMLRMIMVGAHVLAEHEER
ncbi:MAG: HTH-type transcriptional repressor FabR [Lysobacteraceae bacterium]